MKRNKLPKLLLLIITIVVIPLTLGLLEQETQLFSNAMGKKADLVVDVGISYEDKPGVWENLAQGGEEKGRMLGSVVDLVRVLKPEYIRIDHIYDYYDLVSRSESGKLIYNWEKLDQTVNDILASGSKPFFSLSYMPNVMALGDVTSPPINWNEWEELVRQTVEHYSGRSGLSIPDIYYEVWNEPDLFGDYKVYGDRNYLDLYLHSVRGAEQAINVNNFKIGGPATTKLYKNWFDSFLVFAQNNNLRVDFYSWHLFSKNLDDYVIDVNNARKWVLKYPVYKSVEMVISEIGFNSEVDVGYDNNFSAIHTIATSAVLEGKIDKGFIFEIKDGIGSKEFWGRWGIISHEKWGSPTVKPRYRAIEFLNKIGGNKVNTAGQGSWVKAFAKERDGLVQILVVNYDPSGKHHESVPISLVNLPYKSFTFRRIDFLGKRKEVNIQASSNTWRTVEDFSPNTASIFEVIPR